MTDVMRKMPYYICRPGCARLPDDDEAEVTGVGYKKQVLWRLVPDVRNLVVRLRWQCRNLQRSTGHGADTWNRDFDFEAVFCLRNKSDSEITGRREN
ncbi:hypothetical protein R1flu_006492 [Riccia fluitans]|uniref:Uncharacterized protein n=1 Tax=Riccia fluitans TaxID=41844 RepID=A0ABD1YW55_9MARC